jgi:hypothetical protein
MWNAAGMKIGKRENIVHHKQILHGLPEVRVEKPI